MEGMAPVSVKNFVVFEITCNPKHIAYEREALHISWPLAFMNVSKWMIFKWLIKY